MLRLVNQTGGEVIAVDKDIRKIVEALKDQGFEVTETKKAHLVVSLNGQRVATLSQRRQDPRGLLNALAYLKRAGFDWPPRR